MSSPTNNLKVCRVQKFNGFRAPEEGDFVLVSDKMVCTAIVWGGLKESEANANLYAAAPDLLEALQEVQKDIERAAVNNVVWPETVRKLLAALRKANGK